MQRETPERREEFYALREGISDGLRPSLLDWTVPRYASYVDDSWEIDLDRVRHLERVVDRWVFLNLLPPSLEFLHQRFSVDHDLLLQATDIALQWADDEDAGLLESYLAEARSVYCVGEDEDGAYQLQFRQSEELTELLRTEADQPGRAADHLRRAWRRCLRLNPDPNGACDEAVNAVEVVARPVVSPKKAKATLGTMCNDIGVKKEKWETDSEFVDSIETVLHMMRLVWNEGHYRHGDANLPLEVSQESAEMTVQAAVLLVSWFRSGRIRLKSQTS